MNLVYGYIDLKKSGLIKLSTEPSYSLGEYCNLYIEKDNTDFIRSFETDKTIAVMTGYFDQPLDGTIVDLNWLVEKYEDEGSFQDEYLFGSYQIVLLDKQKQEVKLFCDRGGLRSWFTYQNDDHFYFSSKINVFKSNLDLTMTPNNEERDYSLIFGYYPHNHTVYQNVNKLMGNDILTIHDEHIEKSLFTSHKEIPHYDFSNEDEIIKKLYENFMKALEFQTRDHKKVAVHLGGFDSALVASMLKRLGKEVETFTFYYENDDGEFNQAHTDTLSEYLSITHNWVNITPNSYLKIYNNYKEVFDQPTNWPNYVIQTKYITEKCKEKGFTYVVSGDGADSIFQGYPGVNRSAKFYNKISPFITPLSKVFTSILNHSFVENKLGHIYRLIMRVIRNAIINDPVRTFLMFRIFDETTIARLYKENYKDIEKKINEQVDQISHNIPKDISLNKLAYMGRSNMGPNRLKLSGSMDSTGVCIFSPFMHNEIKSLVLSFPDELMRPKGSGNEMSDIGKYILTKMTQKFELLPDEIIFQKKQSPVNSPIDTWYASEFEEMITESMKQSPWEIDKNFLMKMSHKKMAEEMYKNTISADKVTSHALSLFLTTTAFYDTDE